MFMLWGIYLCRRRVLTKYIGFPSRTEISRFTTDARQWPNSFPNRVPGGFPSLTEISSKRASVPPVRHGPNSFPKRAPSGFPSHAEISSVRASVPRAINTNINR